MLFSGGMVITSRLPTVKLPRDLSLHEYFFRETAQYSDCVAFINYNTKEEITFREVEKRAKFIATSLVSLGIEKGEAIIVDLDNRPDTIIILLGASIAGAVTTTVSALCSADEILHQIEASFSRFAFVVPKAINAVRKCFEKLKREYRMICVGSREDSQGLPILSDLTLTHEFASNLSFPKIIPEEDVVILPYSSGIHGDSKGILTTHAVMCDQLAIANHPFYDNPRKGEFTVSMLPYSRHLGLECCLISLLNGATVVSVCEFNVQFFMDAIDMYEARVVFTSPFVVHHMTHHTSLNANDSTLISLKTVIVCTGSLTRSAHDSFTKRFPVTEIATMYSMTETGVIARTSAKREYVKSKVQLASNVQLKVLDMLTGEELGRKEKGVFYVAGPSTSAPYLDSPELDPVGGWRKTGDIGYIDDEDNIHLIDRAKDMIKVFGYPVIPRELEDILSTHHSVKECAVIGVRDNEAGERPIAYVVLKELNHTAKEELIDFVNERLSHQKRLHRVEIVSILPRTSDGAVLRRALADAANLSINDIDSDNGI